MPEIKNPLKTPAESTTVEGNGHNGSGGTGTNGRHLNWKAAGSNLGTIVAGGALAVYGFTRKSVGGTALAAAGGFLAVRGIRRAASRGDIHVERSFTINRPVNEVFSYFRNFENLPKFMHHLKEVRVTDERTSHWVARAPIGLELEWDAEIVEEKQDQYLAWRSLPGAAVPSRGSVGFRPAGQYHGGTEIIVVMDYAPPGGKAGALFARVFGREPSIQIQEDLRRFKQLLETGEIPTTHGQSHGRRTAFLRMVQAVNESPKHRGQAARDAEEHPWAIVS